jgi:hypothetical protein
LDVQDHDSLVRIAKLAARMMSSLRQPGRGKYISERQLRSWVGKSRFTHTTSDVAPALMLLEYTGRIQRPEVKPNTPRPGRLAKGAGIWHSMAAVDGDGDVPEDVPEAVAEDQVDAEPEAAVDAPVEDADNGTSALARAVLQALAPGNGRSHRCSRDELSDRLASDGVDIDDADLSDVLARLEDVDQLVRVRPQLLVLSGTRPYDGTDELAADICASIKRRSDRFESDEELVRLLTEEGVKFDPGSLSTALRQLEDSGRIKRDVVEHSWANEPVGGC